MALSLGGDGCRGRGLLRVVAVLFAGLATALPVAAQDAQSIRYFLAPDGSVTVEAEGAGVGPDTPFAVASVGKALTAVAVLRLAERGQLAVSDPVARHLPRDVVEGMGGLSGITVAHLLTMSSGLPDYYDDAYLDDALTDPDAVQRAEVAIRYVYGEDSLFPPGRRFNYSNTNYLLLGVMLEHVTGKPLGQVLRGEVFVPAGMDASFVGGTRALPATFGRGHEDEDLVRQYYGGESFGDGPAISTAADVAAFYRALLVERRLLSASSLAVMLRDATGVGYGMGLEVNGGLIGHSGGDLGYSADVRLDQATGAIAVMLVAEEDADTLWTEEVLDGP